MRIGIIGFGSIGERHFKNISALKKGAAITVLTKRKDRNDINVVAIFSEFKKQGPYDAIFICNETYKHAETIRQVAALAPKALFIEKPLAMNQKEVKQIQHALKGKKTHVFVGYSRQFYEPYLQIKKVVDSGKLGKIYSVRIAVGQDLSEWRKRDYKEGYSASRKKGGGVVLDLVHEINFPAWLLQEPLRVHSALAKKVSDLRMDAEDVAECIAETKKGTFVSIHLDCVRSPAKWQCQIVAEKGTLLWDSLSREMCIQNGKTEKKQKIEGKWNDMFIRELKFFFSLLGKKGRYSNLDEAERDQGVIDAIKRYGS